MLQAIGCGRFLKWCAHRVGQRSTFHVSVSRPLPISPAHGLVHVVTTEPGRCSIEADSRGQPRGLSLPRELRVGWQLSSTWTFSPCRGYTPLQASGIAWRILQSVACQHFCRACWQVLTRAPDSHSVVPKRLLPVEKLLSGAGKTPGVGVSKAATAGARPGSR
jgi:hypothetical protein